MYAPPPKRPSAPEPAPRAKRPRRSSTTHRRTPATTASAASDGWTDELWDFANHLVGAFLGDERVPLDERLTVQAVDDLVLRLTGQRLLALAKLEQRDKDAFDVYIQSRREQVRT
jgi:hypothetical protein